MRRYKATKVWYWTCNGSQGTVEIEPSGHYGYDLKQARSALRLKWGRQRLSGDTIVSHHPPPEPVEDDEPVAGVGDRFVLEHSSRNGFDLFIAGACFTVSIDIDELSDGDIEMWERIVRVLNKYDDQIFVDSQHDTTS